MSSTFFRTSITWVSEPPERPYEGLKLVLLLNHTSLFEPLYLGIVPLRELWRLARKGTFPGADVTLDRPLVGAFFRALAPNVVTVTRRRDASWDEFLATVADDSLILIVPEGRMKRPTGLDKHGKPMTVRGGIADLLKRLESGRMIIAYSGGLHHVHTPGDRVPRLFQKLNLALEVLEIADYRKSVGIDGDLRAFRRAVVKDLERRRDRHCPK